MAYFIWAGLSQVSGIDASGSAIAAGEPIMVLASKAKTPGKANRKTGDMWQLYILLQNVRPTDAIREGRDAAVCGDCIHRGINGNTCYTYGLTTMAANGMYDQHHAGGSQAFTPDMVTGDTVRLGAYGDPAAVPYEVWEPIIAASAGHTGYTHQWRTCDQRFANICQASCDTPEDMKLATARGWRTYTVMPVDTERVPGAVPCPSPRIKCESCLKCSGTALGRKGNVWIAAHGTRAGKFTGRPLPLTVTGVA